MVRLQARITLKDIAQKSGYTVNTVSHALRGKSDISLATRKKIIEVADELGYVGNTLASSLRSGRSNTIAVIVSDVKNPYFGCVVHNIESRVREAGYSTIILCTGDDPDRELEAVRCAIRHLCDGVLICPCQANKKSLHMLRQSGVSYVVMGRQFEDEDDNQVLCDDEGGAYLLTEYLVSLGHKRIMYISGAEQFSSERERRSGYQRVMRKVGMPDSGQIVIPFKQFEALENQGQLGLLITEHRPTAVFAFRDEMAWALLNQLRPMGMEAPRDISVAGFDYIAEQLPFLPALTTLATQSGDPSAIAAQRLLELIQNPNQPPRTIRLAMRIVDPAATVQAPQSK